MANSKNYTFFWLLLLFLLCAALLVRDAKGSRVQNNHPKVSDHPISPAQELTNFKDGSNTSLIGSVAPTCTYNECRGCKSRCTAKQVPVEGSDPINSPYRYKCVCHR